MEKLQKTDKVRNPKKYLPRVSVNNSTLNHEGNEQKTQWIFSFITESMIFLTYLSVLCISLLIRWLFYFHKIKNNPLKMFNFNYI